MFPFSFFRFVPEVVSSGPAGGQLVSQFSVSREDNEVIQLHTSQQPPPAPYIHARHVVRCTQTELGAHFHAHTDNTDVHSFAKQKARVRGRVILEALLFVQAHCSWSLNRLSNKHTLWLESRQCCLFFMCACLMIVSVGILKNAMSLASYAQKEKSASGLNCSKVMGLIVKC